MPDDAKTRTKITPSDALKGESPLVLTARLVPVAGVDRFQPAGFPEVGHVVYRAPRADGGLEQVCIVDSAASMANHLESVCMRGPHDLDLVDDLQGMPYLRCVTGALGDDQSLSQREVVVTSLTEGHRIASSYFLDGHQLPPLNPDANKQGEQARKPAKKGKDVEANGTFKDALVHEFGIVLPSSKKAHPPPEKWWEVFKTIFKYDPNSLVHGVLFPQWQIKIPRVLTAHLEAFGASRVDRSGVKFDRLGKTTSGQPIFAVDDATAREIRATFILDVALLKSFGRRDSGPGAGQQGSAGDKGIAGSEGHQQSNVRGLAEAQKEFLAALALWKIQRLLATPFRFRSGCHLQCASLSQGDRDVEIDVDIKEALKGARFESAPVTDVYWPSEELYREGNEEDNVPDGSDDRPDEQDSEEGK